MIGPDDFDAEKNPSGVWTVPPVPPAIRRSPAAPLAVGTPAPAGPSGSRSLIWLTGAIVLIGIIAFLINAAVQQRRQQEIRIQQAAAMRAQQERETAAAERRRLEAAAEAKRGEDEQRRQAELERAEVAHAERNTTSFAETEQASSVGVNTVRVSVLNRCQAGDVYIALLYQSISAGWVTDGWWKAAPDVEIRPPVWPTNEKIYFFASGAGFTWEGDEGSPQKYIVGNNFTFKNNEPILGRDKRKVRFRQANRDSDGRIELVCGARQ